MQTQTPRTISAVPSAAGAGRTRSPRIAAVTAVAAKVTALVTGTATEMGAAPRSAKKAADAHRLAANGAEYCHVRRRAAHRRRTLLDGEARARRSQTSAPRRMSALVAPHTRPTATMLAASPLPAAMAGAAALLDLARGVGSGWIWARASGSTNFNVGDQIQAAFTFPFSKGILIFG